MSRLSLNPAYGIDKLPLLLTQPAAACCCRQTPSMTLTQMLAGFVRRHWFSYAGSALMLGVIALLTVWIPRQVGQVIDGLVAGSLQGQGLLFELGLLVAPWFKKATAAPIDSET